LRAQTWALFFSIKNVHYNRGDGFIFKGGHDMNEKTFRKVKNIKIYFTKITLICDEMACCLENNDVYIYIEPGLGIFINNDNFETFIRWENINYYEIENYKE
jgi:hypothetical protein